MSESEIAEAWLQSTIAAITNFATKAPGGVHSEEGPPEIAYPFVTTRWQQGGDVRGVGDPAQRILTEVRFIVAATNQSRDYTTLVPLAEDIDNAISAKGVITVPGGYVHGCVREEPFRQNETENGKGFRHLGGRYLLTISKS